MKKTFFFVALLATVFTHRSFAQDSQQQSQLSLLLSKYYSVKDALVAGNRDSAASGAEQFLKTLNGIDYKVISEGNVNALLKNATSLSEAQDIKKQREQFANLSNNMIALAKAVKLTAQPIYQAYCPMKKAAWLSREKEIKNPYYGSAMLTCGQVVETIQQ
ncbi:MAG TPA: DUF3347 domain-containing protein [Flavisolibacter sp.]|nr:DUF3347 domain-containing protein [Flavisolibacter sp.]